MTTTKMLFACPCCDYLTLPERDMHEICEVCFWEDDGVQNPEGFSMPNHLFLAQGQENFLRFGACDEHSATLVDKAAKLRYKKQDYSNMNSPAVHSSPFVDFLKGMNDKED